MELGPTKLVKNADGTYSRVPREASEIIASKEAKLLEMYAELEALKAANS